MAHESEDGVVQSHLFLPVEERIPLVSVVEVALSNGKFSPCFVSCDHFPHVPHLQELVLPIGGQVDPIPFAANVRDTLRMTQEHPHSIACAS